MVVLNNLQDTTARATASSKNYSTSTGLALRTGGAGSAWAYLRPTGLTVPTGATILSATLRVYTKTAHSGTWTLSARQITSSWSASSLTYSKRPTVGSVIATASKSSPPAKSEYALDVTADLQAVANGGTFYGWRLESNSSVERDLYSTEYTTASLKPTLEVTWTTEPAAPTSLSPANLQAVSVARPTFSFAYGDSSSNSGLAAVQVKYSANSDMSAATDSGEVVTTVPQWTATSDVASVGGTFYWQARVKNSAGMWSPWSAVVEAKRIDKGTVEITAPAISPNNIVQELTPPFSWTFSGTQTAYKVDLTSPIDTGTVYWTSGWITGTENTYTSPVPLTLTANEARVVVHIRDDVDRATTPGDPAYVVADRVFSYVPSASIAPVTGFTFTASNSTPAAILDFSRSTAPDSFTIVRDGEVIADVSAADVLVSGTSYRYVDSAATPRAPHTWQVISVVNGVASASSPTVSATLTTIYGWVLDPENPDWYLAIADNDALSASYTEQSEVHEIVGSDRVVVISQAMRGLEGSFSGGLYSYLPGVGNLTAADLRDRAFDIKKSPSKIYRLVLADLNIPVIIRNLSVIPTPGAEINHKISFDFFQQGENPF